MFTSVSKCTFHCTKRVKTKNNKNNVFINRINQKELCFNKLLLQSVLSCCFKKKSKHFLVVVLDFLELSGVLFVFLAAIDHTVKTCYLNSLETSLPLTMLFFSHNTVIAMIRDLVPIQSRENTQWFDLVVRSILDLFPTTE